MRNVLLASLIAGLMASGAAFASGKTTHAKKGEAAAAHKCKDGEKCTDKSHDHGHDGHEDKKEEHAH